LGLLLLNIKNYLNFYLILKSRKLNKNHFFTKVLNFLLKKNKAARSDKFIYFWESLGYKDESLLKHKSIIH
jgi:hypothetical protein